MHNYCTWFANLVWKGNKPKIDVTNDGGGPSGNPGAKGESFSNSSPEEEGSNSGSKRPAELLKGGLVNGPVNENFIRGGWVWNVLYTVKILSYNVLVFSIEAPPLKILL